MTRSLVLPVAILFGALLGLPDFVAAQTAAIADPTRPAGALSPAPGAGTRSGPRAGSEPAAPAAWPKLQSVQLGDNGSASAMIDGRIVTVGEAVGALTLVAIDAQGVLLRGARFDQRLALLPGIDKTPMADTTRAVAQAPATVQAQAPAQPGRARSRTTAASAATAPAASPAAPLAPPKPAGLALRLDLQLDAPDVMAPAALAQAPTKDLR